MVTSQARDERPPSLTIDGVAAKDFITGRLAGAAGAGVGVVGTFLVVEVVAGAAVIFADTVLLVVLLAAWGAQLKQMQAAVIGVKINNRVFLIRLSYQF